MLLAQILSGGIVIVGTAVESTTENKWIGLCGRMNVELGLEGADFRALVVPGSECI